VISLPTYLPWEVLVKGEDLEWTVIIMAPTSEKAHLAAQELYQKAFVKVVGIAPDWDDAA
jgi:hypothetical protein